MDRVAKNIINTKGFWVWLILIILAWIFDPPAVPWLLVLGIGSWLVIRRKNETIKSEREDKQELVHRLKDTRKQIAVTDRKLSRMEKMAMLGELTAGIAHELKNPINYIVNSATPLKRNLDDILDLLEKYQHHSKRYDQSPDFNDIQQFEKDIDIELTVNESRELIKGIEEGAARTRNIVQELRDYSREDDKGMVQTNIHEAIDSTLALLSNRTKAGIQIVKDYDPELADVFGAPTKLKQVFMNIMDNAIDAMNGNGTLQITTSQNNSNVVIEISDNGHGIPPHVREHIFEPFFSTKEDDEGTGLGLYITKRIIDKHKGSIQIDSHQDSGTIFTIELPINNHRS